MLDVAQFIGFIPVTDIEKARAFYGSTLGLHVLEESRFALVVETNGTMLRITPVPDLRPQPFTIAGWHVDDIDATVDELVTRGIQFQRYDGLEQQPNGVWTSPDGGRVAWFTDPDRNTLSLTEFPE